MQRRTAQLPLHTGQAPPWLFQRMTKMAAAITQAIVEEFGPHEMLNRLSDPWWFQAFGSVLGFDWHSSGLTTVTCGALKQALTRSGSDLDLIVAGGKGKVSRRTPQEIAEAADRLGIADGQRLIFASRMSAKVDSAAVQDGFGIYHHSFIFTPDGHWCVIQQGMDAVSQWARRYHWLGTEVDDFVCEPHQAISDLNQQSTRRSPPDASDKLNLVARESTANRRASAELVREHPDRILEEIKCCTEGPTLFAPAHHRVLDSDINPVRLRRMVLRAHEAHPADFATLLETPGVGPATIRSLSLLAEIIFQAPASRRDPAQQEAQRRWADYSYAHGGKDGTPFPVDRSTYDQNIAILTDAVRQARLGQNDKFHALRRLAEYSRPS